jgi:hypothetical protein
MLRPRHRRRGHQGWLKMQEAVMGIEFPIYDLPEIRDAMFTKESLASIEANLIELYPDEDAAYATRCPYLWGTRSCRHPPRCRSRPARWATCIPLHR